MDWLTRIPVVGPLAAWFLRSRAWRVYEYLDERKWTRLAAAITFTSFLALFPMLAAGAALGAALLSRRQMDALHDWLADQVPGISGQLDLQALADNAGTVGFVAGVLLVFTGVGWVGTLREGLRAMWDLEEDPGNPVLLRLRDLGALIGLGVIGLISVAGSAFAVTAVSWVAERMHLAEGGIGTLLLRAAGYAAAGGADFVLLGYVLTLLPRVRPPRSATLAACLMGAVGFELLKLLLGGYLKGVAAKSMYGAFGVPVALLLWMSFMAKLMLFCAAWTATGRGQVLDEEPGGTGDREDAEGVEDTKEAKDAKDAKQAGGAEAPVTAETAGHGAEAAGSAAGGGGAPGGGRLSPGRPDGAGAKGQAAATSGAPRTRPVPGRPGTRP